MKISRSELSKKYNITNSQWQRRHDDLLEHINHYNSKIESSYLIDDSAWNCKKFSELWWKVMNVKWEEQVLENLDMILNEVENLGNF